MQSLCLGLGDVFSFLIKAFQVLVLVQWAFGLVSADPSNPLVHLVALLVEPPLAWLRRRLPFLAVGRWDLSPLAALLICAFLDQVALGLYRNWAARL